MDLTPSMRTATPATLRAFACDVADLSLALESGPDYHTLRKHLNTIRAGGNPDINGKYPSPTLRMATHARNLAASSDPKDIFPLVEEYKHCVSIAERFRNSLAPIRDNSTLYRQKYEDDDDSFNSTCRRYSGITHNALFALLAKHFPEVAA